MLKRYQVLLDEWLGEHLQQIAKKYDVSFSETIRWALCTHVIKSVSKTSPKLKPKNFDKRHMELIEKRNKKTSLDEAELHKFLSDLYYETRKTIEYWGEKEKKRKD